MRTSSVWCGVCVSIRCASHRLSGSGSETCSALEASAGDDELAQTRWGAYDAEKGQSLMGAGTGQSRKRI
jgi:hypothetical protein